MATTIVLDGPDCSGKTLTHKLVSDLIMFEDTGDVRLRTPRFPGSTEIGSAIRNVLKDPQYNPSSLTERLLFAADYAQFEHELKNSKEKEVYLTDRFAPITDFAYADESEYDFMISLYGKINKVIPDIIFIFTGPHELFMERMIAKAKLSSTHSTSKAEQVGCRIEQKGEDFLKMVCDRYNSIFDDSKKSRFAEIILKSFPNFYRIDATRPARENAEEIKTFINQYLEPPIPF